MAPPTAPSPTAPEPTAPTATAKRPNAPPAATACPATCCGGLACSPRADNGRGCMPAGGRCSACASGRVCIPEPCDARLPEGTWLLRVAGVTANGKDVYPRPKVCLRPSGRGEEWSCTPAGNVDTRATRVRVGTSTLTREGLDFSVARGPDGREAEGIGVHHPAIGITALCRGLIFRFTGEGASYAVTLFLDEDEAP
jgi:hypothetical protein